MYEAFLTGSREYGTPRLDSDIDLVIYCNEKVARLLVAEREQTEPASKAIRFGKLNLIVCIEKPVYDAWNVGTTALKSRGHSVDRETAKTLFQSILPRCQDGCSQ